MSAAVVVVHFGAPASTQGCVRSIVADSSTTDREIVVVDNSGNLNPEEIHVGKVLSRPDNPGFGAAANAGVAMLGAERFEVIVVLNHDVEVLPGFLDAAVAGVREARTGAVGGPVYLDREQSRVWYAGGGVNFLIGTVWQRRSRSAARRRRPTGFIPGAAVAVRSDAWARSGGFDERYFLYNEDLDLCLRLRRLGYRLRFEPGMGAIHHLGTATGSHERSPLYLEWLTRNRLHPFRPLPYRVYLALVHTGYVALRSLASILGRGGPIRAQALLRGHARALLGLRLGPRGAS